MDAEQQELKELLLKVMAGFFVAGIPHPRRNFAKDIHVISNTGGPLLNFSGPF